MCDENDLADTDYEDMVKELLDLESGLTDWEITFLDSMIEWFEQGRRPTSKQAAQISKVWDRLIR